MEAGEWPMRNWKFDLAKTIRDSMSPGKERDKADAMIAQYSTEAEYQTKKLSWIVDSRISTWGYWTGFLLGGILGGFVTALFF